MKQKKLTENEKYQPTQIEPKWQNEWIEKKTYHPDIERAKKPYFSLMMFPYPSAEGLHVGNMYAFTGSDIHGRFKRMQGHDVLEPIGLDGFGIHSENYALKIGRHPMDQAEIAETNFYRQLIATGNSFDWERKVQTYAPDYYKWTQWLFTELFKAGLAYRKNAPVNFCPSCKTVLADEQVEDGKCERCSSIVEKKDLEQWLFRITSYADQLLENIPSLNWSEKVKIAQKKWIGRKQGITISYKVAGSSVQIPVFTTRPDTNFGATFIALAPENPLALEISSADNKVSIDKYIDDTKRRSADERRAEGREKTGVFTGAFAINPLTGYNMPIWVSDFVLKEFGTGAVVGVPAHDKRDFQFAQKFDLEIIRVVAGADGDESEVTQIDQVQEEAGTMINSEFLNGLTVHQATEKILIYLEEQGYGVKEVTYHLRDWLISRQRYWGAPIPMIYCKACAGAGKSWFTTSEATDNPALLGKLHTEDSRDEMVGWYPVPEKDLPVRLPHIDNYKPLGTGKSPLASYPDFYETTCPGCGAKAQRETDVCDTFLDSSWYFFRYTATDIQDKAFDTNRANKWLPVHMYIGGAEHAVLHLLYSRFVTMVLKDLGYISFEEPFARFYAHGLLIKEGSKMSKSKGNVIVPDEYIKKYGADTLRSYLMFLGPYDMGGDFHDSGIAGIFKFLKRVWRTSISIANMPDIASKNEIGERHSVIRAVTGDLEALRYNTAIAKLMTFYNSLSKREIVDTEDLRVLLQLLAPFAPHMTEELWQRLNLCTTGETAHDARGTLATRDTFLSIHLSAWPVADDSLIEQKGQVIAIQINGKLRGTLPLSEDILLKEETVIELVKQQANVTKYLEQKKIIKTIYIPGKVVNFVIE